MKKFILILLLFSSICLGQNSRYINTSDSLLNLGETDLAIDHLNKCLEIHTDEKNLFECLATLCDSYKQGSNYNRTLVYGHNALSLASKKQLYQLRVIRRCTLQYSGCKIQIWRDRFNIFYSEATLVQRERTLNLNHPKIIQNINALGLFYRAIGDLTECVNTKKKH